jgi:hypothetical protein
MEFHSAAPAAGEEIDVAAAKEIEPQIEGRAGKSLEHRPGDQTIAAAVDDRHRST